MSSIKFKRHTLEQNPITISKTNDLLDLMNKKIRDIFHKGKFFSHNIINFTQIDSPYENVKEYVVFKII